MNINMSELPDNPFIFYIMFFLFGGNSIKNWNTISLKNCLISIFKNYFFLKKKQENHV